MESGNGGASSKGVLVPVSDTSDVFQNCILAPLQSAYLYEESQQFFKYKSAVLVKNPALEEKYNIFRAKRREAGYSEEDLKETYGFILFEDVNKAHALGETGVLTRNGTCTTLGDPCKGVYISIYSDCLDLNRWYHGKSGYIAIIRLTKGRVKKVLENYTQNFTAPTVGFDCHVSEQLSSVSAQTSSFLAFERTQYYMYELLGDGSNETAQSPSAACPFAIVSFSYTDTKAMLVAQQETSAEKKLVCHHLPWRGQLQIGTQFYNVALRSAAGALIPAKLPPVVKVNRAISMSDLIQLLPKGVFETVFSGEVFLDNLYCSLCELISSEADETNSLTLLLQQIKEKDLALPVPLNDGGFLILLHSSHFLTYEDSGSSATEVLQGMFVFPESRAIQKGTKSGQRNTTMSSDIFQILPVITYAESEVEKTPLDASDELCEVLAQHMQNYAALINPGLTLSPSRDVSIFPDQYDVLDAHKHLYSTPDWTNRAWQSFKSYMSKPVSFQLSVSEASEILAAGKEERREDLDDDVYICLSSPEEAPANPVDMGSEDQLTDQKCPVNVETPAHSCLTSSGAQVDFTTVPQNVAADDLQAGDATKDNEKSEKSLLVKTDDAVTKNLLINRTSDDLSAELIVSITSAEQTLTDESLSVISTVSATKQNDFQLSGFSAAKLETAEANSLHDETVKINNKDCPEVTNVTKRKGRKLRRGPPKGLKKASENLSSQTVKTPGVDEFSTGQKDDQAKDSSGHSKLNNLANVDWRKLPRRKRKFGKLSSRNKKVRSATVDVAVAEEKKSAPGQQSSDSNIVMELEVCPLRKKTERWDLKPVISKCGRVLVPYGSVYVADLIRCLKNKPWCTKDQRHPEKMLVDGVNAPDRAEVVQDSGSVPEMALGITEATTSKDGGNHLQNVVTSCDKTENGLLRQSDYGLLPLNPESNVHSLNNEGTDTPPSEAVKEKHTDVPSPGKCASKEDFLKLKSVFFRRKRKNNFFVSDGTATDLALNTEPCLKKGKGDSDAETLKSNNAIASAAVNDVSKMQSVDPLFAYALGLTPKVKPDKVLKSEGQYSQLREDSTETLEQTLLDKQPQIIQKPPSIFPRSSRIKTLRKHQGIPAEYIKKKWWLHFQTPACFTTEKHKHKACTRDNSVRKTVKERVNSTCSSTDALNLLADLALSASKDLVPPQPDPALERKPEPSLKKCGLTKDVTNAEQESVLHALLRQPAAKPIQPFESPSPSHLAGESELVGLISKEHAYSLPPSSPLLLGLPGTPFQVSPLSGSTRLLHARQQLHGEGIQTLYPSVCQEDKPERNHRTQECLKKYMVQRRKFRHFRTFVNKGPSVQVTRQWKENYDFNRDSKFSKDSKDRTIIRALHGPWDYSIQDTTEEVRLIVHMWIGLFYSRSTARFFHMESNFECSEESYSVEMSSKMVPAAPALLELKADSFGASTSVTDTQDPSISKTLDLCKKDNSFLDKGSAILDLSLRNCSAETVASDPQVNRKETSGSGEETEASETLNMLKSSTGLQECQKTMVHSTEIMNDVSKLGSIYENVKACSPSQNTGCLEHIDVPSFKSDGLFTPPRKEMESVLDQTENVGTALGTGYILHGCNKDETYMNDGLKNPETSLAQIHDTDSSESMKDKKREFNKEADEVTHTDEHDDIKSKENLCHDETIEVSPKVIDGVDDSTNKELGVISNGNCFKNEKQLSNEEPKSVTSSQAENVNEDVHCQTVCEGQMTTGEDRIGRDCCVSAVACDSNLGDQPLPVMCEGPDSVKDCITDCSLQAPSQTGNEKDTCQNLQLTKLPANGSALTDEHAIPGNAPVTPSEMEPDHNQHANENNSENDICLADKVQYQMAALPTSPERNFSLDGSCQAESIPQTKDNLKTGSQNITMTIFNFGPSSDHIKSEVGKKQGDNTTHEEPFHSPQSEVVKKCEPEPEEALTTETDLAMNKTNEGLEKSNGGVVIPFIGLDMSGEDIQPHISQQQSKVEEVIQGQKEVPFVSEASYSDMPKEICSKSDGNISLPVSETNHPGVLGSESNDRCPTPTLDERPYDCRLCSGPSSSTSAFSSNENNKNITCTYPSSSKLKTDEMPPEQKLCHSTVDSDLKPHHGLHPDLELRTPRVLQRIDKLFSKSNHTDKSNQMEIAEKKNYTDQTSTLNSKRTLTCLAPSYTSADFKDEKISNKPVAVSPSPSHELHKESPDHFLISPFKSKLEEVLGVKLQLKKMDLPLPQHAFERTDQSQEISIGQDYCHSQTSIPSEFLQTITSNINQDRPKTTPQSNLNHEPRSYSQRPVMAVKPSKSDESQAHCISKDGQIENSPKSKHTKTPVVTYTTPTTMAKKTNHFEGNSRLNDEKQESSAFLSRSTLLSKVTDTKSNSDSVKFSFLDPSNQYQVKDTKISSSSLSMQSFESAKSDGHQSFLTCSLLEKVLQTTKENVVINQKDCSKASTSFVDHKDSSVINVMGPQSSLTCTIHNSSQKRSYSFLEQVSQRCLKGDITQVSMEQECLIFSEQMKQVLKRSKRGAVCKQDSQDEQPLSCTSPVTVCFSSLEEQEDSVELLDMPSLVGQKIMVDVSDRKSMTDLTEEEKTLHPQKSSPGPGNLKEHAGVSGATAECARLYDAMMDDVCAVKKVPSGPERFRMDRSHIKTGPSNHFDFCDEMKREVDESFRSNLNSVVKKSCKTKNRFYILVTSDDALFDKTKAQLEAQGHMAIQPSEFLLHEGSSSSLLIILKNEDIAEHICEIPHLLELKKSSGVQFVGIDEPDDVVNLTYQELFMRGGFIMFDRAVLEILSICDMKKFSKILHKLSRTGKWKWMLHYRDSRRLKENARLSTEAKEKKHFLNSCEETGILEVLPYHECDLMSRDQPDYLTCLVRLQVQNISARYPIFITDTMPDSTFGRNGILTMTVDSFLTNSTSEIFTV